MTEKKKGLSTTQIVLIILGCVLGIPCATCGACAIIGGVAKETVPSGQPLAASPTPIPKAAPAKAAPKVVPEMLKQLNDFAESMTAHCKRYDAQPNDIKRSAVFREMESYVKGVRFTGALGELATLGTSQGGSTLRLKVVSPSSRGKLEFSTESVFAPIRRGSRVYKQASELVEGKCVKFSAKGLEPSSMMERSKVCDLDFFARFTEIGPC
jgi:hypothetical protein